MPDLITHAIFGRLIHRMLGASRKWDFRPAHTALFYLGIILPDIVTRPLYIFFPGTHAWTAPLHTPAGLALLCALIALFLMEGTRKRAFLTLYAGVGLHLLLDLFQKQIAPGYYWFFPFTWKTFNIGLFWSDTAIRLLPVTFGFLLLIELGLHFHKKRRTR